MTECMEKAKRRPWPSLAWHQANVSLYVLVRGSQEMSVGMKRVGDDYWFACCVSSERCITGTANPGPCNITKQILKGEECQGNAGNITLLVQVMEYWQQEAEAEAEQEHTDSLGHGSAS